MTTIREERLANGLQILFVDESNRYFGDYHRICLLVTLLFPLAALAAATAEDQAFRDRAIAALGQELKIVKRIERMGVSTADIDSVRHAMIGSFLKNSSPYLNRPEYPRSLVAAELNKRRSHCFYG